MSSVGLENPHALHQKLLIEACRSKTRRYAPSAPDQPVEGGKCPQSARRLLVARVGSVGPAPRGYAQGSDFGDVSPARPRRRR